MCIVEGDNSVNPASVYKDEKIATYCECSKKPISELLREINSPDSKCKTYFRKLTTATSLSFSSAIIIQIMNWLFEKIINALSSFQRFKTVNERILFIIKAGLIFSLFNSGILPILLTANFSVLNGGQDFCIPLYIMD